MPLARRAAAWIASAGLLALAAACSPAPPGVEIHDPYEAANRQVHAFNRAIDRAALRGAGQAGDALPEEVRISVVNFSDNAALPGMVVNGLLQGDVGGAATNTMRFVLNSTVGVLGLFDPAGAIGLAEQETDFGETLAVWGVPEGAYLELPVIGPSTERDAAGFFVDMLLDPLGQFATGEQLRAARAARAAEVVIERGSYAETIDSVLYDSADSYAQARLVYLQNRRFELDEGGATAAVDPYAADAYVIDPYATLPAAGAEP